MQRINLENSVFPFGRLYLEEAQARNVSTDRSSAAPRAEGLLAASLLSFLGITILSNSVVAEKQAPRDVRGASLVAQPIKNLLTMQEITCNPGDLDWIPEWGRSPGEGNGNPLQSCLGNPMDRGVWWGIVHGVARVRHDLVTKQPPQMF